MGAIPHIFPLRDGGLATLPAARRLDRFKAQRLTAFIASRAMPKRSDALDGLNERGTSGPVAMLGASGRTPTFPLVDVFPAVLASFPASAFARLFSSGRKSRTTSARAQRLVTLRHPVMAAASGLVRWSRSASPVSERLKAGLANEPDGDSGPARPPRCTSGFCPCPPPPRALL